MIKLKAITILISGLIVSSCAFVQLDTGGEKVRVLSPDEVSSCRELGKAHANVTDAVFGMNRPIETLQKELEVIGRNSAVNLGGDTIVPLTVIKEGKQTFVVYKCIDPKKS